MADSNNAIEQVSVSFRINDVAPEDFNKTLMRFIIAFAVGYIESL